MEKIENLYRMSVDAALRKNDRDQKHFIMSAISLTENAIKRTPLDADLYYIRGKLYSFLNGNEDKIKSSFKIESALDPAWVNLPLRQSKVWLFIDMVETRNLWTQALSRSDSLEEGISRFTWNKILSQARQHPIQIRDVYEIVMYRDDSYYIKLWMSIAGNKNLITQMPKIFKNHSLSENTKNDILTYWEKLSVKDFQTYIESQKFN